MAEPSSTIDPRDRSPYSVVEYIERYKARLDGRPLAVMRLAGTPWRSVMCVSHAGLRCGSVNQKVETLGRMQWDRQTVSLPGHQHSLR